MVNGPLKNEKSRQILPESQARNLGVSESKSVGHIYAFLSSR